MRVIVCDTGPLLHLREAQIMHILPLAGTIHAPEAIDAEMGQLDYSWRTDRPEWLVVGTLAATRRAKAFAWQQAGLLDQGEAEAIALAQQLQADWLLTDDAAARLVAQGEQLEVHGSLGVVLWVAAAGRLDRTEAQEALEGLVRSSLWLSARVLREARTALEKLRP